MLTFLPLGGWGEPKPPQNPTKAKTPRTYFLPENPRFSFVFSPQLRRAHITLRSVRRNYSLSREGNDPGGWHTPRGAEPRSGGTRSQPPGRVRSSSGAGRAAGGRAVAQRCWPRGLRIPLPQRGPRPTAASLKHRRRPAALGPAGGDTAASHRHPTPRSRPPAPLPTRGGAKPPRIREGKKTPKPQGPGEAFAHPRGGGEQPPAPAGGHEGPPPDPPPAPPYPQRRQVDAVQAAGGAVPGHGAPPRRGRSGRALRRPRLTVPPAARPCPGQRREAGGHARPAGKPSPLGGRGEATPGPGGRRRQLSRRRFLGRKVCEEVTCRTGGGRGHLPPAGAAAGRRRSPPQHTPPTRGEGGLASGVGAGVRSPGRDLQRGQPGPEPAAGLGVEGGGGKNLRAPPRSQPAPGARRATGMEEITPAVELKINK